MATARKHDNRFAAAERLPAWWRRLLVAVATLILCSCRTPLPIEQQVKMASMLAPVLTAAVAGDADGVVTVSDEEAEWPEVWFVDEQPVPPTLVAPDYQYHTSEGEMVFDGASGAPCAPGGVCVSDQAGAGWLTGSGDEYLCDGGDFHTPAGVRADWTIEGLEQEDTVAHYDTVDGRVIVTPSNRVCIYAPRFAAVRQVINPMAQERHQIADAVIDDASLTRADRSQPVVSSLQRHAPSINLGERPPILFRQRQQAGELENLQATMELFNSLAAYANLTIIRTGQVVGSEQALVDRSVQAAVTWTGDQAPQVVFGTKTAQAQVSLRQAGVVYQTDGPDSPRLRLLKLASRGHALPGEELEFTLRFDNIGDQVIGNVTIVDHLTTRLEYVPETAESSVDADFRTEPQNGSTVLRWEIKDPIEPGDGGVLRFRVLVR